MKLKYEGFCPKCDKTRFHRFDGGSIYETRYRCMKCKSINVEPNENAPLTVDQKVLKDRRLNQWLELHGAASVRDKVFDGQGIII